MKNVSLLKSTTIESPKTPGGISKSLLTPCRRVGLSRNWKKAGPSPFISPLSAANSTNVELIVEKKVTRKRKVHLREENQDETSEITPENLIKNDVTAECDECDGPEPSAQKNDELISTPCRNVALPRRKKSKIVLTETNCKENEQKEQNEEKQVKCSDKVTPNNKDASLSNFVDVPQDVVLEKPIKTPVRSKSKSNMKKKPSPMKSPLKSLKVDLKFNNTSPISDETNNDLLNKENAVGNIEKPKPHSPKELTKECVVVIQKKMFKTDKKDSKKLTDSSKSPKRTIETCLESQELFDSSDDVPLGKINKKENIEKQKDESDNIITIEDDDFVEKSKVPIKILKHKNTSTTGLKVANKTKLKKTSSKLKTSGMVKIEPKPSSQSSNSIDDDDDEDFFESKKTILIRKTYDKVTKPLKAKSTGSITQKDIDDLRARIEVKKKLLLAKAVTSDTEELRSLIKKWQRGCQEALMELMDLMKAKCPEKQNMDYSEILETLKIPAGLVGYDSDNDCFNTPDDSSIVLSKFNN